MDDIEVLHDRYTKALLDYAEEKKKTEEVSSDLELFMKLVRNSAILKKVLYHPFVTDEEKFSLIDAINKKKTFSDEFVNFVKLLIKRRRIQLLHGIFLKYRDLCDELLGRVKVFLKTATPLKKEAIIEIKEILLRKLKEDVVIDHSVDRNLVGGIYLKFQDAVYDASIKRSLETLKEDLSIWR